MPPGEHYEGFPQIENGVGMISSFREEFYDGLEGWEAPEGTELSIATGMAAAPLFEEFSRKLEERGVVCRVYPIENRFFGERITVAGLITGQDLTGQLAGRRLGKALLISTNMLKADEDIFLDDMTLAQAQERVGVPILCVGDSGYDLLDKIKEVGEL